MNFLPTSPVARMMLAVAFISALLLLYLAFAFNVGIVLVSTGKPVGIAMGIAMFILPIIGAWALLRELMFGFRSAKLTRILDAEEGLPADDLPHLPSGRTVRQAADAEFPIFAAAVEAEPESWRAMFRLGLAYDASGDRRRARASIREAIRMYRLAKRSGVEAA
jgi:hypothetical protein